MKVLAQHLQPLDVVGSGEEVVRIGWPMNGKVRVILFNPRNGKTRSGLWGAYTEIGVKRYTPPKEEV